MNKNTTLVLSYDVIQDLKRKRINISKICRVFLQEFNRKVKPGEDNEFKIFFGKEIEVML